MTSSTKKRGNSVEARRAELDRALRKPRRVLWAYCRHHDGGYYFFGISIQAWGGGEAKHWHADPDMRKIRGTCMECGKRSIFFVGADELEEHRYSPALLCQCGLPHYHKNPSREFLQQYSAAAIPCRPSPNGRTDVH